MKFFGQSPHQAGEHPGLPEQILPVRLADPERPADLRVHTNSGSTGTEPPVALCIAKKDDSP
jgi:hypothetical protein